MGVVLWCHPSIHEIDEIGSRDGNHQRKTTIMKLQKHDLLCHLTARIGGYKRSARSRNFRSLFGVLAGALMLTAALAPRANATLIVYYNFEDSTLGGAPDFTSETIGLQTPTMTTSGRGFVSNKFSASVSLTGMSMKRSRSCVHGGFLVAHPGYASRGCAMTNRIATQC